MTRRESSTTSKARSNSLRVASSAGSFAEDKDAAAAIREKELMPLLKAGGDITLDFDDVEYATQSFVHAMLAKVIRTNPEWLDKITFKNCTDAVRGIIEIVVDYAQEE